MLKLKVMLGTDQALTACEAIRYFSSLFIGGERAACKEELTDCCKEFFRQTASEKVERIVPSALAHRTEKRPVKLEQCVGQPAISPVATSIRMPSGSAGEMRKTKGRAGARCWSCGSRPLMVGVTSMVWAWSRVWGRAGSWVSEISSYLSERGHARAARLRACSSSPRQNQPG